MMYCL